MGLVMLSSDKDDDTGPTLAKGALIGAGGGLTLGIVEIALRDCHEPSRRGGIDKPGFSAQIVTGTRKKPALGMGIRYVLAE